jgi:DNA-binding HxlR family transcriptional regulator
MERRTQTYGHFCVLARTLERVGDRWTLLVVRDLALGPRRFTDLMDLLGGITPKTLTQRLRELEEDGIVVADREPGRREVWYRLTPAGEELLPALRELRLWGMRYALRAPLPGEPVHPEHLLSALRATLEESAVSIAPTSWLVRVAEGDAYTMTFDGDRWLLERGETDDADVTITGTRESLARFLTGGPGARTGEHPGLSIDGGRRAIRTLLGAIKVFPPVKPGT